jgi:heme-degrading monooxygenase HmoA
LDGYPLVLAYRYRVVPERQAAFERVYGPAGDWARLFARAEGYLGTELLASADEPGAYLLLDRWASPAAHAAFLAAHGAEYERFGAECEAAGLWAAEERLGTFDGVT